MIAEDYEVPDEAPTCPICGGDSKYLGTLGNLDHFSCIDCGVIFSQEA